MDDIDRWVQRARQAGLSDEEIRNQLTAAGYAQIRVESALQRRHVTWGPAASVTAALLVTLTVVLGAVLWPGSSVQEALWEDPARATPDWCVRNAPNATGWCVGFGAIATKDISLCSGLSGPDRDDCRNSYATALLEGAECSGIVAEGCAAFVNDTIAVRGANIDACSTDACAATVAATNNASLCTTELCTAIARGECGALAGTDHARCVTSQAILSADIAYCQLETTPYPSQAWCFESIAALNNSTVCPSGENGPCFYPREFRSSTAREELLALLYA